MEYTAAKNGVSVLPQEAIDDLLKVIADAKDVPGSIVEAGTYRCGTTMEIANAAPEKRVYALDAFGVVNTGFKDVTIDGVRAYTKDQQNIVLVPGDIVDTAATVKDTVSVLVIDCDDYAPALAALKAITPNMPVGAKVVVDDAEFDGIVKAFASWDSSGWTDQKMRSGLVVYTREK